MGKKAKKSAVWVGYTPDEMRAMSLIHRAFGTVTHITLEEFRRRWRRLPEATWDDCPNCATPFQRGTWPRCGWCGFRDEGARSE